MFLFISKTADSIKKLETSFQYNMNNKSEKQSSVS